MFKEIKVATVSIGLALVVWAAGAAVVGAQSIHQGHMSGSHEGMSHQSPGGEPGAATPQGVLIREAQVEGRSFAYRLYSWEERNVLMKGMLGHEMAGMDNSGKSSNHLVVSITGADGKELPGGKVGFIVTGPDKAEFKTLTMAMSGAYGADIPLKAKGAYTVRTKAAFGDTTLTDDFTYTVR